MRTIALVLMVLTIAGCARPEPPGELPAAAAPTGPATPIERFTPDALAARPILATLEPRWVRPDEAINATADAQGTIDWFVASRNPIRGSAPQPLSERAQPDSLVSLTLRDPGRHLFAVAGADLSVSIVPGLEPVILFAVASQEDGVWRVVPTALRGGPGSRLQVEDRGPSEALVERKDVHAYLATGSSVSFTMPAGLELGDYDVIAISLDERSVGENATRVIYDQRKPAADWDAGPFSGAFRTAVGSEPARHPWEAEWDARNVTVEFAVSTTVPAPASVRVSLVDDAGSEIASGVPPGLEVGSIPAGRYAFVVTATEGVLVDYTLLARGEWVLVPPASFFST